MLEIICLPGLLPPESRCAREAPQQNFGIPTSGLETMDLPSAETVPIASSIRCPDLTYGPQRRRQHPRRVA